MTIFLVLVMSGCTLADANECQDDTPDTYANNSNDICVKTTCVNGKFLSVEECNESCKKENGQFIGCGECLNNDVKCELNHQMKCDDGIWKKNIQCTYGCDAKTNRCLICQNGSVRCQGSNIETCVENNWQTTMVCPNGCDDAGKCLGCKNDDVRCEVNEVQKCVDGEWVKQRKCAYGCNGNECEYPSIPTDLTACDPQTFKEVCAYGKYYVCQSIPAAGYIVRVLPCDESNSRRCVETNDGSTCSLNEKESSKCTLDRTFLTSASPCKDNEFTVFLCDKDINGNDILIEKTAPKVCAKSPSLQYMLSCDSKNNEVREICKSCEYDSSGNAVCIKDDVKTAHKLGDSCTDVNASACDGDVLIQCDGTKYDAVYKTAKGTADTCLHAFEDIENTFYCDEIREISHASCAVSCKDEILGNRSRYLKICANNDLVSTGICEIGQSEKQSVFFGFLTQ
ncbi:MAG: hypothetical protein IJU23_04940, partial [Proteobacteria bacterium]|nr:hypothetical protein [Pseudomonadota bacterium]